MDETELKNGVLIYLGEDRNFVICGDKELMMLQMILELYARCHGSRVQKGDFKQGLIDGIVENN
jgi:hypothetical protein